MSKLKIYCLPYAGGSKSIYNNWQNDYSDIGEVIPIEYNGHGELFSEPFYEDMDEMVDDIYQRIAADKPVHYVIYGHSFGSLPAMLIAEKLEKNYGIKPKAVIVGGMRPAHLRYKDDELSVLPKNEFMKHIFDLGQTDEEIMNEPELVDIIYDIISNDVRIEENYCYMPDEHHKISAPIITMTGSEDDEAPTDDMVEWSKYTSSRFYMKEFISDHFFPFNCSEFKPYFRSVLKKAAVNML